MSDRNEASNDTPTPTFASLEAPGSAWWVIRRGTSAGGGGRIDDEDARSIVGAVRVDQTPYPPRYLGYGRISDVLLDGEVIGTDEVVGAPMLSDAAVWRLASLPGVTIR